MTSGLCSFLEALEENPPSCLFQLLENAHNQCGPFLLLQIQWCWVHLKLFQSDLFCFPLLQTFMMTLGFPRDSRVIGNLNSPLPCMMIYSQSQGLGQGPLWEGHYSAFQAREVRSQDSAADSTWGSTRPGYEARVLSLHWSATYTPGARADEPVPLHGPCVPTVSSSSEAMWEPCIGEQKHTVQAVRQHPSSLRGARGMKSSHPSGPSCLITQNTVTAVRKWSRDNDVEFGDHYKADGNLSLQWLIPCDFPGGHQKTWTENHNLTNPQRYTECEWLSIQTLTTRRFTLTIQSSFQFPMYPQDILMQMSQMLFKLGICNIKLDIFSTFLLPISTLPTGFYFFMSGTFPSLRIQIRKLIAFLDSSFWSSTHSWHPEVT